jgi:hypothetical protein
LSPIISALLCPIYDKTPLLCLYGDKCAKLVSIKRPSCTSGGDQYNYELSLTLSTRASGWE